MSAIAFLPSAADPVNTIKWTVVLLCGVLTLAAAAAQVVQHRVIMVPAPMVLASLGTLAVALCAAAVAAPVTAIAVLGAPGRLSGLALYLVAIVLFVSTSGSGSVHLRWVQTAVVAAGTFTATYGVFQSLGWDAIKWANEFNPIIASLGNPNFASGYLGICVPVAAAWALRLRARGPAQLTMTLLAAGMLAVAVLSDSSQGPLAATAGLGVVTLGYGLNHRGSMRRAWLGGVVAGTAVGAALLAAGIQGVGPLSRLFGAGNFTTRRWYWDAALSMWSDRPLLGVGLDSYGLFWRTSRPLENVATLGGGDYSDAAHSVPLHLLATGGLLVAVTYAAFAGIVATALLRGLYAASGADRLRLAGVGGGWVAFQVQSLVSIDQVPLVVLNFVLAGAVLAASGTWPVWEIRLPGALVPVNPAGSGKRRAPSPAKRARALTAPDLALLGLLALGGLALAWAALIPLRADVAVRSGDIALRAGNGNAALAAFDHAIDLLPGRSLHWSRRGDLLAAVRQPAAALDAYDQAVAVDPANIGILLAAAKLAEEQGQLDRSRSYHRQAVAQDPYNPATIREAATFELRHGGASAARVLLEEALARTPATTPLWLPLGDARQVLGDKQGAISAYEEALRRDPAQTKAAAELAELKAAPD